LTSDNLSEYGDILQPLSWWEFCHDVLIHGDSQEKAQVIAAFKNKPVIKRNTLFKSEFDFIKWLRNFISQFKEGGNGTPDELRTGTIEISIG